MIANTVGSKLLRVALLVAITATLIVIFFPNTFLVGPAISALSILLGLAIAYPFKRRHFHSLQSPETLIEQKGSKESQQDAISGIVETVQLAQREVEPETARRVFLAAQARAHVLASMSYRTNLEHLEKSMYYKTSLQPNSELLRRWQAVLESRVDLATPELVQELKEQLNVIRRQQSEVEPSDIRNLTNDESEISDMLKTYVPAPWNKDRWLN